VFNKYLNEYLSTDPKPEDNKGISNYMLSISRAWWFLMGPQ